MFDTSYLVTGEDNAGEWVKQTDIPEVCSYPTVVQYGQNIYLIGGEDRGHNRTNIVYEYSPENDNWSAFGNAIQCGRAQGTLWKDRAFIVDSWRGFGYFNLSTREWVSIGRTEGRIDCAIAECNGLIYLCGGAMGGNMHNISNTVVAYEPYNDVWYNVAPMNTERYTGVASNYNGSLYIFGGQTFVRKYNRHVEKYDPETDTWKKISLSPFEFSEGGITNIGDNFIITGTKSESDVSETHIYNTRNNSWKRLPDAPVHRYCPGLTDFGPEVYYIGGREAPGYGYTNNYKLNCSELIDLSLLDDHDKDEIPDYIDQDDDNDGFNDTFEQFIGTYIMDRNDFPRDLDNDDILDFFDNDIDGDGILNLYDAFPYNNTQWNDTDGDGWGDNYGNPLWDSNRSVGQYVFNAYRPDRFPLDITQWIDSDEDGYGDNVSGNNPDNFPYDPHRWDVEDEQDSNLLLILSLIIIAVFISVTTGIVVHMKRKNRIDEEDYLFRMENRTMALGRVNPNETMEYEDKDSPPPF